MKAKTTIKHAKTALVLALYGVELTAESQANDGFSKALNEGANACFTIRVVDNEGIPVQGASIESRFDASLNAPGSVKAFLTDTKPVKWVHSYFIGNSLFDIRKLYEKLVKQISSTKPEEDQDNE